MLGGGGGSDAIAATYWKYTCHPPPSATMKETSDLAVVQKHTEQFQRLNRFCLMAISELELSTLTESVMAAMDEVPPSQPAKEEPVEPRPELADCTTATVESESFFDDSDSSIDSLDSLLP